MDTFQAYGVSHGVVLVILVVGLVPAVALGRHDRDRRISRVFAVLIPCFTIASQTIVIVRYDYGLDTTLPLQLCDLAWMAAAWALWTHHRLPVALTYYWGLALTTQAVLTPVVDQEFPHPNFVAFWGQHLLIIWAAVFLTWGRRRRPTWWSYGVTLAASVGWLVAVFGINAALGTNFGYVNEKPSTASILDLLGPWPVYVLVEFVIVAAVWALMTWPWTRAPHRRTAPGP